MPSEGCVLFGIQRRQRLLHFDLRHTATICTLWRCACFVRRLALLTPRHSKGPVTLPTPLSLFRVNGKFAPMSACSWLCCALLGQHARAYAKLR
eukprot:2184673-Pleurochrysis_carterae.AAC.2